MDGLIDGGIERRDPDGKRQADGAFGWMDGEGVNKFPAGTLNSPISPVANPPSISLMMGYGALALAPK